MSNQWIREWSWSDFRKQHPMLTEQAAKTRYLLELQMYESNMYTLHVHSINSLARGGAAAISSTDGGQVTVFTTIDTNLYQTIYQSNNNYGVISSSIEQLGATGGTDFVWLAPVISYNEANPSDPEIGNRPPIDFYPELSAEDQITVDWGDGTVETVTLDDDRWSNGVDNSKPYEDFGFNFPGLKHTYSTRGTYTIKVTGDSAVLNALSDLFTYSFTLGNDTLAIDRPINFTGWKSMITEMGPPSVSSPEAIPNRFSNMDFRRSPSSNLINYINNFDVSNTKIFNYLFMNSDGLGELNLTNWNTSNVISLHGTFGGLSSGQITVTPLWRISGSYVSGDIEAFKAPQGISNWDTSKVRDFSNLFIRKDLTDVDLSNWVVNAPESPLASFKYTFMKASGIRDLDTSTWDVSNCTNFYFCFYESDFNNDTPKYWVIRDGCNLFNTFRNQWLSKANAESIMKGWADNPSTGDNVNSSFTFRGIETAPGGSINTNPTYTAGSNMDLAIQTLTAKGWTISGITIS